METTTPNPYVPCGHPVCEPSRCLVTGHEQHPGATCHSLARRGTGVGACSRLLDGHGYCDRPADHIDL